MRAEKDGAALGAQAENEVANVTPAQGIKARHRLIQEQHLRIVEQRLREADALRHPLGESP